MKHSHSAIVRRITLATVVLTVTIHETALAVAADSVSVTTQSGRTFRGVVDTKSDDGQLWLRFGSTQAQILRPIAWDHVVSVEHRGKELAAAEFRALVATLQSAAPRMPRSPTASSHGVTDAERAQAALAEVAPRVASLEITAYPANWDRDVEVDGLIVTVTSRDANGELLSATGTLEVELLTEMSRVRETITSGESRIRNQRIGRWTRRVEPEHFGLMGASYRLPFEAIHPEFQPNLINLGLVNARLSVPGAGTFNASATDVRVRPLSTYRDRYENRHGGRFEPIESTGRGKSD